MKFCVKLSKKESPMEQWTKLIGCYNRNAKLEKVAEIVASDCYVLCFQGSIKDYLDHKHFFGNNKVFRCDW